MGQAFQVFYVVGVLIYLDWIICFNTVKKCPNSKFFWSMFSGIWTEYGEILCISPYSAQMRKNTDQNNSEYGHFLRSANHKYHYLWNKH